MSNDKAREAREGLLDNVAGKAKEVAGAVTGKDDLVEEGQLQQEEARKRKEAVADEAIADAQRDQAAQEMRDTSREAAQQEGAARTQADREKSAADQQKQAEHDAAATEAQRQEAAGAEAAEEQADRLAESRLRDAEALETDATTTQQQAMAEAQRLEREADAAAGAIDDRLELGQSITPALLRRFTRPTHRVTATTRAGSG